VVELHGRTTEYDNQLERQSRFPSARVFVCILEAPPERRIYPAAIGNFTALPRERGVPFQGSFNFVGTSEMHTSF
jgi:hypothetical protein